MPNPDWLVQRMCQAAQEDPRHFVESALFSGVPFAFPSPVEYDALRSEIAGHLGVQSIDIHLVGSAMLGFSLNPARLLRPFGRSRDSDLDFVVVNSNLFDESALELATRTQEIHLVGGDERRRLKRSRDNLADGFIRPDQLPLTIRLAQDWFPLLAGPFVNPVARMYPVKAWLFKSLRHATIYYSQQLQKIQPELLRILSSRGDL